MKNPQTTAKKWSRNLGNATQDMKDAANAVSVSPTESAAARKDEMRAKLLQAIDNGDWEAGLRGVSLADWKKDYIEKGIPRVAQGAQAAEGKMASFLTDFLPIADQVSQEVKSMPKLTLQDSINRSAHAITRFAEFKKRRR